MNYDNHNPITDRDESQEDSLQNHNISTAKIEEMFPEINIGKRDKGITIASASASGAGGQNVNKRETKAVLYLNIAETDKLTPEQKKVLMCHGCLPHANAALKRAWNRITAGGILRMDNQEGRTIERNIENVLRNLNEELNEALAPRIPRKEGPTKKVKAKIRRQKEETKKIQYKRKRDQYKGSHN